MAGADADNNAGDRSYLVKAKPDVIMNDTRLRGLAVAEMRRPVGRGPDNHAPTPQNLRRYLRNAAAGAWLIQAEGLDMSKAGPARLVGEGRARMVGSPLRPASRSSHELGSH